MEKISELVHVMDSECRAITFALLEHLDGLRAEQVFTDREIKLKKILKERLCKAIDIVTDLRTLTGKIISYDDCGLSDIDVDQLLKDEEKKEDRRQKSQDGIE